MAKSAGGAVKTQDAILVLSPEQKRLYERIPTDIDFVPHRSFSFGSTEKKLFGVNAKIIKTPNWILFQEIEDRNHDQVRCEGKPLNIEEEAILFLRYNYARYRLSRLIKAQKRQSSFSRAKQMLLWHERILSLRSNIVEANLGLVLAIAQKTRIIGIEFTDLISEGNMALLRSVEKFDVSKGFKFSTYAYGSIFKAFSKLAVNTQRYRQHFPVEFDPSLEGDYSGAWVREQKLNDAIDMVRYILDGNIAGLDAVESKIVAERFGIVSREKGKALVQVGKIVGLCNERVRQIQDQALEKIRLALEGKPLIQVKKRKNITEKARD